MKFSSVLTLAIAMNMVGVCVATAQVPTTERRQPAQSVEQQFLRRNGPGWRVRLSADGRRITSVVGLGTRSYGEQPEPAARSFLLENAQLFGLRPDLGDLEVRSQISSSISGHVEYRQMVSGLQVENARIHVNLSHDGRILDVKNGYFAGPTPPAATLIDRSRAIDAALDAFIAAANAERPGKPLPPVRGPTFERSALKLKEEPQLSDIYYVENNELRRAYLIIVKAQVPFGVKEFVVDAVTGRVLRTRDYVSRDDGSGQVFRPNPVNTMNNNALTDSNYATTPNTGNNPNPFYTVPLLELAPPNSGNYRLTGPFVTLEEVEDPAHAPPTESSSSFTYTRGDNFDDAMVYYHIDAMERYIQQLGFININNRQVRVDSDGFPSSNPGCGPTDSNGDCDNSHYIADGSGTGAIAFGHGGVDDDEDAEIIAHEYGHSIQDNTNAGAFNGASTSNAPAAMGEGFGDYWAVSMFSAETTASGHTLACVGEWDATSYSSTTPPCLRRVDGSLTMDDFVSGADEHDNGQIWSRTLFDLFNALGRTTADRLVLQSHFNVPSSDPQFKDGGDALVTADLQLFFGSHIAQICTVLTTRKIYSASDCPVLPSTSGTQATTVVLVRFNDSGLPSSPLTVAQVGTKFNDMSAYLGENSFSKANLGTPTVRGWFDLGNSRAHYYDSTTGNMLVDLVTDVINVVHASDPGVDFSLIDRLFIITNDDGSGGETRGRKEWATTGPWPYAIPSGAGTKRFSASVNAFNHSAGRFDHVLGHHFGMFDLYAHEGVTFPRPYADGWSNMAQDPGGNFNNVHFFAWDKLKPGWLADANVRFVPRPPADPDANHRFEETIAIFKEETASGNPVVIQVGTTPNVTQRRDEQVSYYIEARKKSGTYDTNLPSDAVLAYYVNEDIGQGFGPLRLIDAQPGTSTDLTDAGLLPAPATSTVGNIDTTGLDVEVLPKTGTEDYRVHIVYDPPETQNDTWIHPHDTNWRSQDIWVDSPACNAGNCGFDTDNGRSETDRGDEPQPSVVNRLYARVYNHGPATAHNVRVDFFVSEPHHAIDGGDVDPDTGDNVSWNEHFFTVLADVPAGDAGTVVFVNWTPSSPPDSHVHTCVKVKIAAVFNDINPANQASQENIDSYDLTSHSPYPPVQDDFKVANPYDHPILAYLRADDVPVGWTANVVPEKVYLPVGGSVDARMTIQAPLTYPICSTEFIKATAWYAAGDTLVPLGASVAQVNLKKSTDLTSTTTFGNCGRMRLSSAASVHNEFAAGGQCEALTTKGCTNPPRPFEHITLTYTGPDGNPIYHDVVTDKDGCFQDFVVNPQGGPWSVHSEYPGNYCNAETSGGTRTVVVIPGSGGVVPPGRAGLWYSFHLGLNSPTGSFDDALDAGPSLTLDAEYPWTDRISIVTMLGLHVFEGDPDPFYYTNLSVNAKAYMPLGWANFYVEAGPGIYFPKSGSNEFGVNVGAGFSFPVNPKLKIEVGPDLHVVDPGGDSTTFIDARLGIVFHF